MKRRIFVFALSFFCLVSVIAQQKQSDKKIESVSYQWIFRAFIDDDFGKTYDVYLYESVNDEEHYLFSLPKYCGPWVDEASTFKKKGASTVSTFSSWYAGGGVGGVLLYVNGKFEVYKSYLEEDENGSYFVEKEPAFVIEIGKTSKFVQKDALFADVPEFKRTLKVEKRHVYGEDVFYLQSMLFHFFNQKIDIDGYFGKQTEAAVKEAQKKLGLSQTGIVTESVWEAFEECSSEYVY